jgi:putative transposase
VIEVGKNFAKNELIPIDKRVDKLKSVRDNVKNGQKIVKNKKRTMRNIRNRNFRLRNKIQNKVRDMQWKTVNMLTNNFKTVVTTTFGVKEMVNKDNRRIGKDTVREMQLLSFDKFKRKLLDRGARRGCEIKIVDEEYTSKTCGNCGTLGAPDNDRILRCKGCGKEIKRDINGSRNIMIKIITEALKKIMEKNRK